MSARGGARRARGAGVLAAVVLLGLVALSLGDYPLSPSRVVRALLTGDGFAGTVVRSWRAPRVVAAVCFGAALALSGAVFQSLTDNPLGSPDVIGFTTGSYTGVVIAVAVLGGGMGATTGGALVGGLVAAVTAVCGPISFVSLACPQIARLMRGGGAGLPLVDTALVGSLVLLVADLAAQYALPVPVPAGVVTIVFGGGYLLWMLIARNA